MSGVLESIILINSKSDSNRWSEDQTLKNITIQYDYYWGVQGKDAECAMGAPKRRTSPSLDDQKLIWLRRVWVGKGSTG